MANDAGSSVLTPMRARTWSATLLYSLPSRWDHTKAVAAAASASTAFAGTRANDLVVAAWLHDIGYATTVLRTGFHPVDGANYLAARGAPARVVSLVAHHSCSRFEARERGFLDELYRFDEPPADLADALIYADMTTGPTGETVTVDERIAEILRRYPEKDPVHSAIVAAGPELRAAVARVQVRVASSAQPM